MWVQVAGGLFAIYGLWLAVQRIDQTKADLARKEKEERVARYLRSMVLLGSTRDGNRNRKEPNIESRLGAVGALRALWLEANSDFHYILPVLNDYVSENLRRIPNSFEPNTSDENPPPSWRPAIDGGLRPDIRVALEFLIEARHILCMEKTFLDEVEFRDGALIEANFRRARLRGARLERTNLLHSDFRFADLTGANLKEANLSGADLRGADLTRVCLDRADLAGSKFWTDEQDDLEEYRGIKPAMVAAARNWATADFSPAFRKLLYACAAEQTASCQ